MSESVSESFVFTLSAGVHNLFALLPFLGTTQCEMHAGSALKHGYLYAAAAPLSIFGSPGLLQAGFAIGLASTPSYHGFGASLLKDFNFEPSGEVTKMITLDEKQYLAETNLTNTLGNLHVDNHHTLSIKINDQRHTIHWNFCLIFFSFLATALNIIPYLHFIILQDTSVPALAWLFPLVRAIGGSFCVIAGQLLLQRRILTILRHRITYLGINRQIRKNKCRIDRMKIFPHKRSIWRTARRVFKPSFWWWNSKEEKVPILWCDTATSEQCLWDLLCYMKSLSDGDPDLIKLARCIPGTQPGATAAEHLQKHCFQGQLVEKLYQTIIFIGMVASVIGYVGCFTLVNDPMATDTGRYLWIVLEAVMALIRMAIWASDSLDDDSPGLKLSLQLSDTPPPSLHCVDKDSSQVKSQTLPVVDGRSFVAAFIASCGSIPHVNVEFITTYYARCKKRIYLVFLDMKRNQVFLRAPTEDTDKTPYTLYYATMDNSSMTVTYDVDAIVPASDPLWTEKSLLQELCTHCDFVTTALNERYEADNLALPITIDWLATPSYAKSLMNLTEAWASIRELMENLMRHPTISIPPGYYQGCQELYTYHDKLLGYYGCGNQEDASMLFFNQMEEFFVDYVVEVRNVAEMQPVGQLVEFYKTERRKFKQGVKRIDSLLYTWENWQSYLSFAPEEEDFGLSVKDLAYQTWNAELWDELVGQDGGKVLAEDCRKLSTSGREDKECSSRHESDDDALSEQFSIIEVSQRLEKSAGLHSNASFLCSEP